MKGTNVYCTIGFENIPKEVRELIKESPFQEFIDKNRKDIDKLQIYWVNYEQEAKFAGYATHDKFKVFVTFNNDFSDNLNLCEITNTYLHELNHKMDDMLLKNYQENNLKEPLPFYYSPSIITEKNSYTYSALFREWFLEKYSNNLESKNREIIKASFDSQIGRVKIANFLLGLDTNNRSIIHPPYTSEIPLNTILKYENVYPCEISLINIQYLYSIISKFGYNNNEKDVILNNLLLFYPKSYYDVTSVRSGYRDLFRDFLMKNWTEGKRNTNGFLNKEFSDTLQYLNDWFKENYLSKNIINNLFENYNQLCLKSDLSSYQINTNDIFEGNPFDHNSYRISKNFSKYISVNSLKSIDSVYEKHQYPDIKKLYYIIENIEELSFSASYWSVIGYLKFLKIQL